MLLAPTREATRKPKEDSGDTEEPGDTTEPKEAAAG